MCVDSILVCEKMSKSTELLLCVYKGEKKTLTTEGADLARSRQNGQGSDAQEKHFSSTLVAVFPNKCTTQSPMKCTGSRKAEQLCLFSLCIFLGIFFPLALIQRDVFRSNQRH